jgi:hypothetical protein
VEFLAAKLWFGAEGAENVLSTLEIGGIMPFLIANNFSRLAYSITKGGSPNHDIVGVFKSLDANRPRMLDFDPQTSGLHVVLRSLSPYRVKPFGATEHGPAASHRSNKSGIDASA